MLAVLATGGGHSVQSFQQAGMGKLAEDAQGLGQVARSDKQEIHRVVGGDRVGFFQRAQRFDLNGHKLVAVGVRGELLLRFMGVMGVAARRVQSAQPAGRTWPK